MNAIYRLSNFIIKHSKAIIFSIIILGFFDSLTTCIGVLLGLVYEANPLMANILNTGWLNFFVSKQVMLIPVLTIFFSLRKWVIKPEKLGIDYNKGLAVLSFGYLGLLSWGVVLIINNIIQMILAGVY